MTCRDFVRLYSVNEKPNSLVKDSLSAHFLPSHLQIKEKKTPVANKNSRGNAENFINKIGKEVKEMEMDELRIMLKLMNKSMILKQMKKKMMNE